MRVGRLPACARTRSAEMPNLRQWPHRHWQVHQLQAGRLGRGLDQPLRASRPPARAAFTARRPTRSGREPISPVNQPPLARRPDNRKAVKPRGLGGWRRRGYARLAAAGHFAASIPPTPLLDLHATFAELLAGVTVLHGLGVETDLGLRHSSGELGQLPVIALENVSKHYRGGGGIDDVTFEVHGGEVFGFLGANGAGKTTTIRLLVDLIRPDRGHISLFGLDPRREGTVVRRRIGYLPGDLALYDRLTPRELLTHFAHLRGGPPWEEVNALCQRLDLELDRPVRALSKGNRQKVGLVQAFMGRPDLLVLDEPTTGLDPLLQHQVHDLLREAAGEGRSVFLSSHILSEVQRVADRVGMIRSGRVIAIERVSELRAQPVHLIEVRACSPIEPRTFRDLPGVTSCVAAGQTVQLEVRGSLDPVVRELARHDLADLSVREPELEDVFLSLYESRGQRRSVEPESPIGATNGRS